MSEISEENRGPKSQSTSCGIYRAEHDWSDNTNLSYTLIMALQNGTDLNPIDGGFLLREYVNIDGLNKLFLSPNEGEAIADGQVEVTLEDYDVTIHASGDIIIQPTDE